MVYKKYIKRGDKLFGPYYYKSIKKDGKVITQYVKNPEDFPQKESSIDSKKNFTKLLIFPLILLVLVVGLFILKPVFTGKATLSVENAGVLGETFSGDLRLNLEPKEFIPASTKFLVENNQEKYEFILSELVKESPTSGEFYVSGTEISGFGEGYGEKDLEVFFVLDILSESKEIDIQEIEDNINVSEDSPASHEENKAEIINETETPENISEEQNESEAEKISSEEEIIEEITTEAEIGQEVNLETSEENNELAEETTKSDETIESEITGGAIFNFINNLFLTITGKTSLENTEKVQGKVSKNKPFIYALEDGQTAEIIESNKKVNLEIINNFAVITTEYLGEGAEYLINLSELNISVKNKNLEIKLIYNETEFYSKNFNFEVESNQTIQETNFSSIENLTTIQYGAKLGEPVKWRKKITVSEQDTIIELPKQAENISVYKIENQNVLLNSENLSALTTGNLILEFKSDRKGFFSKIAKFLTGRVIEVTEKTEKIEVNISENGTEYEIEYETPGPVAFEKNTSYGKEVVINSEVHYENVLAYTNIPENKNLREIKLYQILNDSKIPVDFIAYDDNNEIIESDDDLDDDVLAEIEKIVNKKDEIENKSLIYGEERGDKLNYSVKKVRAETENLVSYIEWVVPSLSNQTYELILITKAQHLDSSRNFISDIYEQVKALDGNWSEQINDSEYVRVTFEKNLTFENDITIYPRSNSSNVSIKVYENNKTELIAEFSNIIDSEYNKVYLTNLNGTQNIFDLKILGGSVEFDYIVDPIILGNANSLNTNTTYENNFTHLNVSNSSIVLYMPFDDNVSATTIYDYSNNSNDGTISGAVYNASGWVGGAYTFDGVNDRIAINNTKEIPIGSASRTFSLWINANNNLTRQFLVYTGTEASLNKRFALELNVFNFTVSYFDSGLTSNFTVMEDVWNNLVVTYGDSVINIYVNGVLRGSKTVVLNTGVNNNITLGAYSTGAFPFNGSIDELMIWKIALNSTEVLALYRNQTARFHGTGEMNFTGVNFAGNDTINITLAGCQQNMGTSLRGKVNDGAYVNFDSNCFIKDYNATGNLNSANVTISFVSDAYNFYTPLVIGNITVESNPTFPTISYDPETPADNSSINVNSIYVNVSVADTNFENMSYSLYNESLNISGLVGYWNFDRNTTTIRDLSKQGNNGVRNGGVNWTTGGKLGEGFSFDGVNDFVNINPVLTNNLATTTVGTWSVWVKPVDATPTATQIFLGFGDTDATSDIWLSIMVGGTSRFLARSAGTIKWSVITDAAAFSDGVWTHVVGVQNGTIPLIYINGVAVAQTIGVTTDKTWWFNNNLNLDTGRIASLNFNSGGEQNLFKGSIDEVMIFNRALSSSEITDLYNRSLVNHTTYSTITESINWTGLVDNDYHYFADVIDKAENYNSTPIRLLKLDTTFPTLNFINPTTNTSNLSQNFIIANLSFTEANLNITNITLFNSTGNPINSTTGTTSTLEINFTGLADGTYYLNATISDTSGNRNQTETRIIRLDTTFPTLSFANPTTNSSNLSQNFIFANLSFTETNINISNISLYNSTQNIINSTTGTTSILEINFTGLADGTYYLNATISDTSGNRNQTETRIIGLDATFPTITINLPSNNSFSSQTNLSVNFTVADSNLNTCWYSNDTYTANTTLTNCNTNLTTVKWAEGQHNVTVWVNDTANNVNSSMVTFTIDTTLPTWSANETNLTASTLNGKGVYFNITLTDSNPNTYIFSWYNGTAWENTTSSYTNAQEVSITKTINVDVGTINWTWYINDSANNLNQTDIWSITLLADDNVAPNISFANPTTNATNLSQNFIYANLSFADATSSISMANISLFNSTQNIINSSQGTTSTLEINFTGLVDGTYYLNASVNDTLGNKNQTETRRIILDTIAPNLTINSPTSGTYGTSTILFNSTSIDLTTLVDSCWYTINSGTTNRTLSKNGATNFYNFTQTSISDSTYTARFYCNDSANNVNNTENIAFTVDTSVPVGGGPAPTTAGGGGGAGAPSKPEKKRIFNLEYNMYDQTISLNQILFDVLQITNNGEIADEYNIEVKTIDNIISFEEKKINLEPGEAKEIEFKISSPKEPGIYTGKIIVSNGISEREVLVTINVKTEKSLFDITLTIPNSLKTLLVGQNLVSKIDLIQMGLKENIDVTLNYVIKDFDGQTYLTESETIAVLDQKSFEKEFFTGELSPGQYVLGTELIHPDGVAVASTHFVVQEKGFKFGKEEILLTALISVLILISLIIFLSIRKYKRVGKLLAKKKQIK